MPIANDYSWPECETVTLLFIYSKALFEETIVRSIWCRDFTIICITKELEVKMSAHTSFISDVHKSYRVEKIVLHHLIFLLIKISKCLLAPNAILSQLQI